MRLQDENKKEAIFEASIKLVNEIGFVSASVAKIAKEAKVSPATLYIYHKNKEDLLVAIYTEIKRKLSCEMLKDFDLQRPLKESMKLLWTNSFDYIKEHQHYFMFAEQFANSPYSEKVDKSKINEYFAPFFELIQKGINDKIVKDVPIDVLGVFAFFPVMILSNKKHCSEFSNLENGIDIAFEMAWDAIAL